MTKINSYKLMCFIFSFFIFYASKTIFGGQVYGNEVIVLLAGITIFYLSRMKKIKKHNLKCAIGWCCLIIVLCILNGNDNYLYVLKILFTILVLSLVASMLSRDDFIKYYIIVVSLFSGVSLFFFLISLINVNWIYGVTTTVTIDGLSYIANPLYTFKSVDSYTSYLRNSGPFWEPGAFQGFIVLAVMFLLRCDSIKKKRIYLMVLIVTLITTQSTTGYIILLLLVLVCRNDFFKIVFGEKSATRYRFFYILATLIIVFLLFNSVTIQNKFTSTNVSYLIRQTDFVNSLKIIKSSLLVGYGCGTEVKSVLRSYDLVRNSNGLFQMIIYFGVPFGIIYICRIYSWLKENLFLCNRKLENVVFFAVLLLILATEGLCFLPMYLFMFFKLERR